MKRLLFLVVGTASCEQLEAPPPPPPQEIVVHVTGNEGAPLAGVLVGAGQRVQTETDARGFARLSIDGEEGTKVDLAIACPTGYAAPSNLAKITVRRTSRPPRFDIPCKALEHAVVIAFKTTGAANVPVLYLGRELTRTDEAGYGLIELEPKVGETLTFTLDTSAPEQRYLRPQNPELSVQVPDGDEALTLEQKFTLERPPPRKWASPMVPKNITSRR